MSYVDNVLENISSVALSGLGDVTLSGAVDVNSRVLGLSDDGASFEVTFVQPGTGTETRTGCVYTHSTRVLTRGELLSSTTGAAITLTTAATAAVVVSASSLTQVIFRQLAGPDAATAMQAGVCYAVDLSTFTAIRPYTLPATARVGERVQIIVTAGSPTNAVIIQNGAAEWSRLFITNESVVWKCTAANTWSLEYDGRIPCSSRVTGRRSVPSAGVSFGPTISSASVVDVGGITQNTTNNFVARRAGKFKGSVTVAFVSPSSSNWHLGALFSARFVVNPSGWDVGGQAGLSVGGQAVVTAGQAMSPLMWATTTSSQVDYEIEMSEVLQ